MSQATGPAGAVPPVTLASLIWGWGGPYAIRYGQDQWRAARRDGHAVLAAPTLAGLEAAIEADYRHRPVPRECDPPAAGTGTDADTDTDTGRDEPPGEDESFLLAAMRAAFPAWTIEYSTHTRVSVMGHCLHLGPPSGATLLPRRSRRAVRQACQSRGWRFVN